MDIDKLQTLQVFEDMAREDVETILTYCETVIYSPDTPVFEKDEQGGSLYIVVEGGVQISAVITHDLKKSLAIVPAGGVFGEMSLFTRDPRSASALAVEQTTLLKMSSDDVERLTEDHPDTAIRLIRLLIGIISDRLRNTNDMYRQALEWSISVSGAIELHLDQLITNNVNLTVKLNSGDLLRGRLLKVDQHVAGHVLILESEGGSLEIVPYQAVAAMSFDKTGLDLEPHTDLL